MAATGFTAAEETATQQAFSSEQPILRVAVAVGGFGTGVGVMPFTAGATGTAFSTGATAGSFAAGAALTCFGFTRFGTRPAIRVFCAFVATQESCLPNGGRAGSLSFAATWNPYDAFIVSRGKTCH